MSLSKGKCLYSNNCFQFLKRPVPLPYSATSWQQQYLYLVLQHFKFLKHVLLYCSEFTYFLLSCLQISPHQNGATTLSITAFSITTLNIMGLVLTLSINDSQHRH